MSQPRPHHREHRHHRNREDRHDRIPRHPRGHEQGDRGFRGDAGGGYLVGTGQGGYATQPQPVRQLQGYPSRHGPVGYATQLDPSYQQQRVPTPDSQVTVSGLGYQHSGGDPSCGQQQGHQQLQAAFPPQGQGRAVMPSFQQPQGGYQPQTQGRPAGPGYPQQQGEYQPQSQGRPTGPGYPQQQGEYQTETQVRTTGPGYQQQQGGYQPQYQHRAVDPGYPQQQGGYQLQDQGRPTGPGYPQQQGGYQPQDQGRPTGPGYLQQQGGYQHQTQGGPTGPGYEQQQGEYRPQDQRRAVDTGYQQQRDGYSPRYQDRPTGDYPTQDQDEHRNPGYFPDKGETDVSRMRNDDSRQYASERNLQGMEGDGEGGNRESYREDSQKAQSDHGGWWSRKTKHSKHHRQNRHSSPADMLDDDKVKHPIRRRRVISDKEHRKRKSGPVHVVNPMGMRLRRCLPEFDFNAFAKQLDEDELKTFLPHQPSIPEPDYSDDEEEGEEEEEEPEGRVEEEEKKEEEVDRELERRAEVEGEGRKESDINLELVKNERMEEKVATDVIMIDKSRPKKKKVERREFVKEEVGDMKDEDEITGSTTKKLSSYQRFKLETSKKWRKTKVQLWETLQMFVVWRGSFKDIEGQHGSSTTSYFSVLRWLMFLNLFVTIIMLGAIVLPQVFFQPNTFPKTFANTTNQTVFQQTAMTCSNFYKGLLDNRTKQEGVVDKVLAVIQGTGWMERTVLFAGFYFNKTYQLADQEQRSYNMPLAFLFTTAVYFFITLILMILYTGDGVKEQLLSAGEQYNQYFNKIFSAWDYTLMQEKAADQKKHDLWRTFKNDLEQIEEKKRRKAMSTLQRVRVYIARICVNLVVLAFWAGTGYLIYMVVTVWSKQLLSKDSVKTSEALKLIVDFLPSLTITILNVFIPTLFYMLVRVEDLTPEVEVEITVARSVILRLASIIVLVVSLQKKISKCRNDDEDASTSMFDTCHNCDETQVVFIFVFCIQCWETYVGGQFYKLVVLDFFVTIVTTVAEFLRRIVAKALEDSLLGKLVGLSEFDLPKNVLDIVYSQTICWIGAFFCPLIPAITVVKFFLYFYLKKFTLLKNYARSPKAYRASKTNTFFMAILLASFVLCAIVMAYVVGRMPPSVSCGPWRVYSKNEYFMYVSVSDIVSSAPYLWRTILKFLTSWLFYVPMLIVMSLVIYYNVAVASGNKRIIALLKEQLAMEGMDKQFLLKEVHKAMNRGTLAK